MNSFVSFSDLSPSNSIGINKKGFIKRGVANIPVDASGCTSNNLSPIYTGNDNELSVLCKKLLKKDQVTKAKSISDILNVIKVSVYTWLLVFTLFLIYLPNLAITC